jgi:hypothetical protein
MLSGKRFAGSIIDEGVDEQPSRNGENRFQHPNKQSWWLAVSSRLPIHRSGVTMRVERFSSVESYTQTVNSQNFSKRDYGAMAYGHSHQSEGQHWDAGVGFNRAIVMATEGDRTLVESTSADVDRLVTDFQIRQEPRRSYANSVAGSRVSVPEYLGGSPFCMKRRMPREMSNRSINIYVCTTCAAGIPARLMLKRGATILALLEFLQLSQVSVELYLTAETHGNTDGDFTQVIQVESHPLDLSTAGFAIAHPAFARQITYAMAYAMDGFNGQWPSSHYQRSKWWRGGENKEDAYVTLVRQAIGMQAGDIYIPAPVLQDEEIIARPENWLSKRIETIKESL